MLFPQLIYVIQCNLNMQTLLGPKEIVLIRDLS